MVPESFKYAKSHEWIDPATGKIGISDTAQDQLGDMVFVEFPEVGEEFSKGDRFGSVESVKAVSDCYLPVSGKIKMINDDLLAAPEIINHEPFENGWLVQIDIKDPAELDGLMDAAAYEKFVAEEAAKH
ncbi:glycine cleavage system protein GcvH [bacterium]|nr:glycine cleavage system protein GcvH [bacterium]